MSKSCYDVLTQHKWAKVYCTQLFKFVGGTIWKTLSYGVLIVIKSHPHIWRWLESREIQKFNYETVYRSLMPLSWKEWVEVIAGCYGQPLGLHVETTFCRVVWNSKLPQNGIYWFRETFERFKSDYNTEHLKTAKG